VNPSLWLAWRFRHDSSVGSRRDSPNLYTSSIMWQIYLKMNDNLQIPNNYWYGEKQLIMKNIEKSESLLRPWVLTQMNAVLLEGRAWEAR
jgi:hypothetical protein